MLRNAYFPFLLLLVACALGLVSGHEDDHGGDAHPMSHHYRFLSEDPSGPNVVVVADRGSTTAGPFAFSNDLYTAGGDMLATANGRTSVTGGIPLTLNFVLYAVDGNGGLSPLEGAEVFVWQADTAGLYSAVTTMNTDNQAWLRARATSDAQGKTDFKTILPGWYPGRAIHWHFRVRLKGKGENDFYVTSQLFVADNFLQTYSNFGLYAQNSGSMTFNANDSLFRRLDSDVASALTLSFEGSNENGYTTTFHVGIDANDAGISLGDSDVFTSDGQENTTSLNGDMESNGSSSDGTGSPETPTQSRAAMVPFARVASFLGALATVLFTF